MSKCVLVTALLIDLVLSKDAHTKDAPAKRPGLAPGFKQHHGLPDNDIEQDFRPNYNWRYNVEYEWPGRMCRHGMGSRQSPIDIDTTKVIRDVKKEFIKYGPLQFRGYENVLVSAINNGHTLQFSTEGDPAMHPTVTGGPLKHQYRLEQMHFHWLSEHAINGQKYPMELHFVHVRADLDVEHALNEGDGLAIIAVFCNVLSQFADRKYAVDEDLMQHIPNLVHEGSRISGVVMDLNKLLSSDKHAYYTYAGSLTTPQCNEVVVWILFEMPIFITDEQYRFFGKTGIGYNNFRSIQPLDKHVVYGTHFKPHPAEINTPTIVVAMNHFVQTLKDFFKNVSLFLSRGFKPVVVEERFIPPPREQICYIKGSTYGPKVTTTTDDIMLSSTTEKEIMV